MEEYAITEILGRLDRIERALSSPPREYVDNQGAAEFSGYSTAQLDAWRSRGGGPRYIKQGKKVLYRVADLRAFLDADLQEPLK